MFYAVCKKVELHVSVVTLKQYLYQTFAELENILQDADIIDQVMKLSAVSAHSQIVPILRILLASSICKMLLREFLTTTILFVGTLLPTTCMSNHSVRTTQKNISTTNKITFRLQWKAQEKTLKDIRNVLYKAFGYLSVRVEIVVIQDGSVVVVCWAPQHLTEELVRLAKLKRYKLREMGVVKLTIGGTEVSIQLLVYLLILLYYNSWNWSSRHWNGTGSTWQLEYGLSASSVSFLESSKLPALKQPVPTSQWSTHR